MKDVSDFPEVKQPHEDIPIYSHHAATDEEKVRPKRKNVNLTWTIKIKNLRMCLHQIL